MHGNLGRVGTIGPLVRTISDKYSYNHNSNYKNCILDTALLCWNCFWWYISSNLTVTFMLFSVCLFVVISIITLMFYIPLQCAMTFGASKHCMFIHPWGCLTHVFALPFFTKYNKNELKIISRNRRSHPALHMLICFLFFGTTKNLKANLLTV